MVTKLHSKSSIAELLWATRTHRKLTFREAAAQIGISASYLHDIERNAKDPTWSIVKKILVWKDTIPATLPNRKTED